MSMLARAATSSSVRPDRTVDVNRTIAAVVGDAAFRETNSIPDERFGGFAVMLPYLGYAAGGYAAGREAVCSRPLNVASVGCRIFLMSW